MALTIPFTQRVCVPAHVLFQQIDGESVLLNLDSERYFSLDEVGTRFWAVLTNSGSIQSAYETLLAEYEVDAELLRRNFQEWIEKLFKNRLVETVSE